MPFNHRLGGLEPPFEEFCGEGVIALDDVMSDLGEPVFENVVGFLRVLWVTGAVVGAFLRMGGGWGLFWFFLRMGTF